jgi:pyridoxine 5-phosphate synthase
MVEGAKSVGADRIEFYTGPFAKNFSVNPEAAIKDYIISAKVADEIGIGINAGHDLNLYNLKYFKQHIPTLLEVSIGHALIVDAIYYGLHNTVQMYKNCLK